MPFNVVLLGAIYSVLFYNPNNNPSKQSVISLILEMKKTKIQGKN